MFFFISLSLHGTSIPRKYLSNRPQVSMGYKQINHAGVGRTRKEFVNHEPQQKNRDTHGRTVRVGRAVNILYKILLPSAITYYWKPFLFLYQAQHPRGRTSFHQLKGYKCFKISIPPLGMEILKNPNFTWGSSGSTSHAGNEWYIL